MASRHYEAQYNEQNSTERRMGSQGSSRASSGSTKATKSGTRHPGGRKAAEVFAPGFDNCKTYTSGRQDRSCKFCKTVFPGLTADAAVKHILHECKPREGEPLPDQAARDAALATQAQSQEAAKLADLPPLDTSGRKKRKGTVADWVDTEPVGAEMKKKFDTALFLFVVMAGISFAAVDSPYFLQFIELIRPNYTPAGLLLNWKL